MPPSVLIVHTGNIINDIKMKTTQTATDELVESISNALEPYKTCENRSTDHLIECFNEKNCVKINKDERKDIKLTVKVLLRDYEPRDVKDAIAKALSELEVTFIESLIVAFPPREQKLNLELIMAVWTALEEEVKLGRILTIGISDLDTELLIELYNWSEVKPSVNQVNLASCCVIPQEMAAFAKENDIQLLTHADPRDILPDGIANEVVSKVISPPDGKRWLPLWVVRYTALVKCRGVIQNKGFIAYFKIDSN